MKRLLAAALATALALTTACSGPDLPEMSWNTQSVYTTEQPSLNRTSLAERNGELFFGLGQMQGDPEELRLFHGSVQGQAVNLSRFVLESGSRNMVARSLSVDGSAMLFFTRFGKEIIARINSSGDLGDPDSWSGYTIDSAEGVGMMLRTGLVDGRPILAYLKSGGKSAPSYIRIAIAANPVPAGPVDWNVHNAVRLSAQVMPGKLALTEIAGRPAVAIAQEDKGLVKYAYPRNDSPSGTSDWRVTEAVTDVQPISVGLTEVDGKPALAYSTGSLMLGGPLHYLRAEYAEPVGPVDWEGYELVGGSVGKLAFIPGKKAPALVYMKSPGAAGAAMQAAQKKNSMDIDFTLHIARAASKLPGSAGDWKRERIPGINPGDFFQPAALSNGRIAVPYMTTEHISGSIDNPPVKTETTFGLALGEEGK